MEKYIYKSRYFYGNEISEYGLENGYMDYRTLAKAFDMVMNNNIIGNTCDIGWWDIVNGSEWWYEDGNGNEITVAEYEELEAEEQENWRECYKEIFQYYIVDDNGASILQEMTDELLFYNEKLDMYVWGVTHWGTSWDYVLTDIKLDLEEE